MTEIRIPQVDLANFRAVSFSYDAKFDIAVFHLNRPAPGIMDAVDGGWYLRMSTDESELIGLEFHVLRLKLLPDPFFAALF